MTRFANFILLITIAISTPSAFATVLSGSGFFVTPDGYFVTNFHVIKGAQEITITAKNGQTLPVRIVRTDPANDLAILKAEGTFFPLPIGNSRAVKPGQRVVAVGYPHVDIQGLEAKVTDGIINSLSGAKDDPRVFQISVPVQAGNSGGPVVTQDGNVVGIVVSKLSAIALLKATGDLPENVNYAIKSNYLLEVLASIPGVEGKLITQGPRKSKEPDGLASVVEESTGLVLVKITEERSPPPSHVGTDETPNKAQIHARRPVSEIVERIARGEFSTDYTMNVTAPDTAENGAVVPFFVNLSTPIGAGETLWVFENDQYLAYLATPLDGTYLSHLSGRVKMPTGSGTIRAVVTNSKGELKSSSKKIKILVGVSSFDSGESAPPNPTFKIRSVDSGSVTDINMLINSPSSSASFVESITAELAGGGVMFSLSPVASKNPFVGFKVSRPRAPRYNVIVKDSQGGSSTASGQAY